METPGRGGTELLPWTRMVMSRVLSVCRASGTRSKSSSARPTVSALWNRNREGQTQDWSVEGQFKIDFVRETKAELGHQQAFELFEGTGFREQMTTLTLSTEWYKWLAGSATYQQGTAISFDPAPGLLPSLGNARVSRSATSS